MNEGDNNKLPTHPFWQFSLQVYEEPNVEAALLHLQDHYDLNINLVLYCCWFAKTGLGRIKQKEFKCVVESTRNWHRQVTESLRKLRRKASKHADDPSIANIKKHILNTEIAAEHIEQLILVERLLPNPDPYKTPEQRLKDAYFNIQTYTHLTRSIRDCHADPHFIMLLAATFHEIDLETISACYNLKPSEKIRKTELEDVQGDLF